MIAPANVAPARADCAIPAVGRRPSSADIARDDLSPHFAQADAVINLAWLIQPSRDGLELEHVNVGGSRRVFEAAADAGVPALVHASSVGVYSPGPKDRPVDESWPRDGVASSSYSRHKAAAERALDDVETANPRLRVVRLRPDAARVARHGPRGAGDGYPARARGARLVAALDGTGLGRRV